MSYNSSAVINITNNTGGNAKITLSHRYSDDTPQVSATVNVAPGATASNILTAGFNTGFLRTGQDYWWVGVQVLDGPNAGNYASEGSADNPGKQCTLESPDNGKSLTFSVDINTFFMALISGSCTTSVSRVSNALVESAKNSNKVAAEVEA